MCVWGLSFEFGQSFHDTGLPETCLRLNQGCMFTKKKYIENNTSCYGVVGGCMFTKKKYIEKQCQVLRHGHEVASRRA